MARFLRIQQRGILSQVLSMPNISRGFTLIELMIVVAIVAVLAAIAFPQYANYRIRANESSCMAEMKNYANLAVATLQSYGSTTPPPPPVQACQSADTAVDLDTDITGTPRAPGVRPTTCAMQTAPCSLSP